MYLSGGASILPEFFEELSDGLILGDRHHEPIDDDVTHFIFLVHLFVPCWVGLVKELIKVFLPYSLVYIYRILVNILSEML